MWNANSQGGLFAYSLRNQRAHSRRTLGAVTTDIPLSRQRSRSGRQLRNQPGCSLSRRRSTNSRGSATMQMRGRIPKSIATTATGTCAKGTRPESIPLNFEPVLTILNEYVNSGDGRENYESSCVSQPRVQFPREGTGS